MPAPNGHSPTRRQIDHRHLAGAQHVGQQQDGDEGRHHEIEIAQGPPAERPRLDGYRPPPFHPVHAGETRATTA